MKNFLTSFFNNLLGAGSKEIRGILVLTLLIIGGLLMVKAYKSMSVGQISIDAYDQKKLDSLVAIIGRKETAPIVIASYAIPVDPNSCSSSELENIGFSVELANRIIKYRNAGGSFKIKSDLLKIYGMTDSVFNQVSQYLVLPDTVSKPTYKPVQKFVVKKYLPKAKVGIFDINLTDTAQLRKINGIGPVLSMRILSFRDKLGGFVRRAQLYEVYNLDSIVVLELLSHIFIDSGFVPKKIAINKMDKQELADHPYLSRSKARLIVAYREQHGEFLNIRDITKVYSIDSVILVKLAPYIIF